MSKRKLYLCSLAGLAVLLALGVWMFARSSNTLQWSLGLISSQSEGAMAFSYTLFNGAADDRIQTRAGSTIVVDFDTVVRLGKLTISVVGPDGAPLQEFHLTRSHKQRVSLKAPQDGNYTLSVKGEKTSGKFAVAWFAE